MRLLSGRKQGMKTIKHIIKEIGTHFHTKTTARSSQNKGNTKHVI